MPAIDQVRFGDIDVKKLQKAQVRAAFVAQVPFRFRVGKLLRFPLEWTDGNYEMCIHNSVEIASQEEGNRIIWASGRDFREVWSDVLIIVEQPTLTQAELAAMSQKGDKVPSSIFHADRERALAVLNQLIIACETVMHRAVSHTVLRTLTADEFDERLEYVLTLLCPQDYELNETEIKDLVTRKAKLHPILEPMPTWVHDLDQELLAQIPIALHNQHERIWHEFAFQAWNKLHSEEAQVALLMAVIALEAVHAELVRIELSTKLAPLEETELQLPELFSNFLREQGLHALNPVTPFLLMDENERPSADDVVLCQKAITMCNDIVHARQRKGKPKVRFFEPSELRQACHAVLRVYECYRRAVEARMQEDGTQR